MTPFTIDVYTFDQSYSTLSTTSPKFTIRAAKSGLLSMFPGPKDTDIPIDKG